MKIRAMAALLFLGLTNLFTGLAHGATPSPAQIDTARVKGLAWVYQKQQGDGGWRSSPGLEVHATSSALDALKNAGVTRGASYYAGMSNLMNAQPITTDARARQLSTLFRSNIYVVDISAKLQGATNSAGIAAWGALPGYGTDIADTGLALAALLETTSSFNRHGTLLCDVLLPTQRANGGWSYSAETASTLPSNQSATSLMATVYAVLSIKSVQAKADFSSLACQGTVADRLQQAVTYLKTKRNTDGGFGEYGGSGPLETVLAYQAIKAVDAADTTLGDALGYLVSMQATDGSWSQDAFVTGQVLRVFPYAALTASTSDGIPDAVKTYLNLSILTPIPGLFPGNGSGTIGDDIPFAVVGAYKDSPFTYSFTPNGGAAPYTFSLAGGVLPTGLSLNTGGTVSGTPQVLGPFNFSVKQASSGGNAYINAQIVVSPRTEISLTLTPSRALYQRLTDFVAKVSPSTATGTITIQEGSVTLKPATALDGTASVTYSTSTLSRGNHTLVISYSGDQTHAPRTLTQTIYVDDLAWLPTVMDLLND